MSYPGVTADDEFEAALTKIRDDVTEKFKRLEPAPEGQEWFLDVAWEMDPLTWRDGNRLTATWRLRRTPNRVSRG